MFAKSLSWWRLAVLVVPWTVACQAHVQSQLLVDGAPFAPTSCQSGAPYGYSGVELGTESGQRLRLSNTLDGRFQGAYFAPGAAQGDAIDACGALVLSRGTGVINGVRNLDGSATLSCAGLRHRVEGAVRFENCH